MIINKMFWFLLPIFSIFSLSEIWFKRHSILPKQFLSDMEANFAPFIDLFTSLSVLVQVVFIFLIFSFLRIISRVLFNKKEVKKEMPKVARVFNDNPARKKSHRSFLYSQGRRIKTEGIITSDFKTSNAGPKIDTNEDFDFDEETYPRLQIEKISLDKPFN